MYKAIEIAKYVINYSEEIGNPISNLKLQKLLYYIQAAMLVEKGKKCFDDPIIAWEFGPVVVSVYQAYREYGRGELPVQEMSREMIFDPVKMKIVFSKPRNVEIQHRKIINKVIESYAHVKNPFELVKKTHKEDPWQDTNLNKEIDCDKIRKYYSKYPEKLYG